MMERSVLGVLFLTDWLILSTCFTRQYYFIDKRLSWTEAQALCRKDYTDLATIDSQDMSSFLKVLPDKYGSDIWIGLYSEIDWRWSDGLTGTGADYRRWESSDNEPDFISANQFCVLMGENGNWWDYDCMVPFPFVCYEGSQADPKFVLVNETMNWTRAQQFCRESFTDMAIVKDGTQDEMIQTLVPSGNWAWTGLFRDPNFYWSDNSSFTSGNWDRVSNEINSTKTICGATNSTKPTKWKFLPCEEKLPFVCYNFIGMKRAVKLKFKTADSVKMNDPVVREKLLKQLQQKLKENGVTGVTLKWRERDGEVFHKEKKSEL